MFSNCKKSFERSKPRGVSSNIFRNISSYKYFLLILLKTFILSIFTKLKTRNECYSDLLFVFIDLICKLISDICKLIMFICFFFVFDIHLISNDFMCTYLYSSHRGVLEEILSVIAMVVDTIPTRRNEIFMLSMRYFEKMRSSPLNTQCLEF